MLELLTEQVSNEGAKHDPVTADSNEGARRVRCHRPW